MKVLESVFQEFKQRFSGDPVWITKSPGRVNLIGEHTDYNGGFVLPCALQFGTYLLIRRIEEPFIRLVSTDV